MLNFVIPSANSLEPLFNSFNPDVNCSSPSPNVLIWDATFLLASDFTLFPTVVATDVAVFLAANVVADWADVNAVCSAIAFALAIPCFSIVVLCASIPASASAFICLILASDKFSACLPIAFNCSVDNFALLAAAVPIACNSSCVKFGFAFLALAIATLFAVSIAVCIATALAVSFAVFFAVAIAVCSAIAFAFATNCSFIVSACASIPASAAAIIVCFCSSVNIELLSACFSIAAKVFESKAFVLSFFKLLVDSLTLVVICFAPSYAVDIPLLTWFDPSSNLFALSCNVLTLLYKLSILSNNFKSSSSITFGVTYVIILLDSKSSASIVISILLGISIVFLLTPKLSCKPGIAIPITTVLLPSFINLPFETVMFLLLSFFIIFPATTTNGVYIFTFFPLILTICESLFV